MFLHTCFRSIQFILSVFILLLPVWAAAKERILSFHSDIHIYKDSTMKVVETIKVLSEQKNIRRGIYRDFPTKYEDRLGNNYHVGFHPVNVIRNGSTEDWHSKDLSNGVRTYFGKSNRTIGRGEHEYIFTYTTDRQLGYFDEHDELYWNVTGNGWDFPIDKASATVYLPVEISSDDVEAEAYTGRQGSTQQKYRRDYLGDGTITLVADRKFGSREGLTIVVTWPKGIIHEPTTREKIAYIFRDNRDLVFLSCGLILLLIYYLFIWHHVGRDPEAGVIITQYEPPKNYSPAALRYIDKMAYDDTCFAAALINLGVNGYLRIEEDDDNDYTLVRMDKHAKKSAGERALTDALFGGMSRIKLIQTNHKRIKEALDAHKESLKMNYQTQYFITNQSWFILGMFITITILGISVLFGLSASDIAPAIFMTVWLSIWSLVVVGLAVNAWSSWKSVNTFARLANALGATVFFCAFGFFEAMGIMMYTQATSVTFVVALVLFIIMNFAFFHLLKAPTRAGRKLLDKIDGFRRFIEIAEKQDLEYKHPKGRSPELFEEFLPHALALGIEQQWAEKFADVLEKVKVGEESYNPVWYSGRSFHTSNIGGFTSSLGSSLSSSISSSSTAPGSSSGGGGGGFSGGGGGGGGGGGW